MDTTMTGPLFRIAVAALLLSPIAGLPAAAESGAFVDLRPTRALRMASASQAAEIPGVTYPRNAPPDLVAEIMPEPPAEVLPDPTPTAPSKAADAAEPSAPQAVAAVPSNADAVPAATPITLRLDVDLATQRLTITERGDVKAVWPISSGRAPTVTKTGTFRPQWASRMWYSRQYDMAPMPHAVFFNDGIAFHATQATHLLGRPASHGCVRLAPQNARSLYGLIHAHGYAHTEIVVAGAPKIAAGEKTEKKKPRARISGNEAGGSFWTFF